MFFPSKCSQPLRNSEKFLLLTLVVFVFFLLNRKVDLSSLFKASSIIECERSSCYIRPMIVPQKVTYTTTGLQEACHRIVACFFLVLPEPPTLCFIVHASSGASVMIYCQMARGQVRLRGLTQCSSSHLDINSKLISGWAQLHWLLALSRLEPGEYWEHLNFCEVIYLLL